MAKWNHGAAIERSLVPNENGCLIWQGKVNHGGYGYVKFKGEWELVHRLIWQYRRGPIPEGLVIDHVKERCSSRACGNVDPMEIVTSAENNRRGNGWSGRNARKTHCVRGHPFFGPNLIVTAKGFRRCRSCKQAAYERRREQKIAAGWTPRYPKTHCKRGHPYTSENTAYYPSGGRRCMACNREYAARVYANKTSPEAAAKAQRRQERQELWAEQLAARQQRHADLAARESLTPTEQIECRLLDRWLSENIK